MTKYKADEESAASVEKTAVAKDLEKLKKTVLRLATERERLPQPLFWSLFNSRLKDIKKSKEVSRILREALGEVDEL